MALLRIPFPSPRLRDRALDLLLQLDFEALDKSEPDGRGVRPQAGEAFAGLRDGRRQIIVRGDHLPQWAGAVAAGLAWRWGRREADQPWAQLFLDETLMLVASTSLDVRGCRGLLEVDARGKLLAWRDGGRTKAGPRLAAQTRAVDQLLAAIDAADMAATKRPRARGDQVSP